MNMSSYVYEPLDPLKREIRLVRIHPHVSSAKPASAEAIIAALGQSDDANPEISLSIFHASLNDDVKYNALSYVWGKATDTVEIQVDGRPFQVTQNLALALRELRHDKEDVIFWIDALCIQQSSNDEKAWQVQLMKDIYEKADKTIVWLGTADEQTAVVMGSFMGLAEQAKSWDIEALQTPEFVEWLKDSPAIAQDPSFAPESGALKKLLGLEYWFRTWCLQEFCVSKEILVACGPFTVDLETFYKLVTLYLQLYSRVWYSSVSEQDTLTAINRNPNAYRPENTAGTHHGATRMLQQRETFRQTLESPGRGVPGQSLSDLLVYAFTHESVDTTLRSTDPRDRVYGLLNLASDKETLGIRPDYNKTCEQVFIETWAAVLARGQASLLVHSQYGRPRLDVDSPFFEEMSRLTQSTSGVPRPRFTDADGRELPSWVPDWRVMRDPSPTSMSIDRPYTACRDKNRTEWIPTDDIRIAALKGVRVDVVEKVGTTLVPIDNWMESGLKSLDVFLTEIIVLVQESASKNPEAPLYDENARMEAVFRIPVGDREGIAINDNNYRRATLVSAERYMSAVNVITEWNQALAQASENPMMATMAMASIMFQNMGKFDLYLGLLLMTAIGWKPFITSQGYVGLGPDDMEVGDVVSIFYGAPVPFVLRPVDDGKFKLMGEAYVHGIMDGEFMKEEREEVSFYLC